MENQHRKISGYRELNQEEIDLMNEIKQLEIRALVLVEKCRKKIAYQYSDDNLEALEALRADLSNANRWTSIARTNLEQGFMALVRSVAQPQPIEIV